MNKKTTFLGAVAGLSGLLPISAHAALPGAELSLCWAIPFAGILLSIALGPLLFAHFWHKNYGKVALMWAVLAAVPLFMFFGTQTSIEALAHALIGDYVPFIIFVGSLYIVARRYSPERLVRRQTLVEHDISFKQALFWPI